MYRLPNHITEELKPSLHKGIASAQSGEVFPLKQRLPLLYWCHRSSTTSPFPVFLLWSCDILWT